MKVGELPFTLHRRSCPWSQTTTTDQNSNNQPSPTHQRPSPLTALLFEANESSSSPTPSTGPPTPPSSPPDSAPTSTATTTTPQIFASQRCSCPCSDCVKLVRDSTCGMDMDLARWLTKCAEFGTGHTSLANINVHDRQLLVCSAWKDIVILYMAQNKFNFDVVYSSMLEYLQDVPIHQYVQTNTTHHTVDAQFQADFIAKTGLVSQTYVHPLRRGSDFGIPTMRTVNQLQFTLSKLNQMQLDSKEYAVLRILLLLNSDLHSLTDSRAIEVASEKVHTALMEYETLKYPDDPLRLSHMLLLLPGVRGFSAAVFENLFYHHLIGDTSVTSVLRELMVR
nr:retinoic acid receptor RXR-alpha-B-like [Lytechinus pictus]